MRQIGLDAHGATVLWTQLAVLLLLARGLGALARRLGQPPIIGSLLAGLVAGPSVFGHVWPDGFQWFLPARPAQPGALGAIAGLCLLLLLIDLGAETDLPLIRALGRPAAVVIAASILLPLAAGLALAYHLPRVLVGHVGNHPLAFALLVAGTISVSSLPVVARIIGEMGMLRRDVGQLTIATATANDGYGFLLLAFVVALASPGGGSSRLVVAGGGLVGMIVVLGLVGQRAVDATLRQVRRHGPDPAGGVAIAVVTTLVLAAVAQALGLDAALGAFLAGVVLGRSRFLQRRSMLSLTWAADALFAPLYFATAGLSVDVTLLRRGDVAVSFVAVLAVALVAKFAAARLGGWIVSLPVREANALGVGLNGRGAMQVILGSAGLTTGLLSPSAYTVVILMSIVSSMLVPPLLRRSLRGWQGTEEEQARLREEEQLESNVVVRGQRLLLPTRGSRNSFAAARVLDLAWPASAAVTLLSIDPDDEDTGAGTGPDLEPARELLAGREVTETHVADDADVVEAILAEANLGYGVIALGAAEEPAPGRLLRPAVEELLNRSPVPLLIVRRGRREEIDAVGRPMVRPRHLLVPVTGNASSRAGQEVATTISRNTGAEVTLLHVLTRPEAGGAVASDVLSDAEAAAADADVRPETATRSGASSGEEILAQAAEIGADLVVVGAAIRRVSGRPFLGHTVEHLLEHGSDSTVVVVALPDTHGGGEADDHADRSQR